MENIIIHNEVLLKTKQIKKTNVHKTIFVVVQIHERVEDIQNCY